MEFTESLRLGKTSKITNSNPQSCIARSNTEPRLEPAPEAGEKPPKLCLGWVVTVGN